MKRSQIHPMPEYFDRYINLCDDVELLAAIQISIQELKDLPMEKLIALEDKVYAPGKWTVKDIFQHMIDTERIFTFRALSFAREEKKPLPSYDENEYATAANANHLSIERLVFELQLVHQSFLTMYENFSPEMLNGKGQGFKGEYSVASIGFIMPGHQRWHLNVIQERYLPLIG